MRGVWRLAILALGVLIAVVLFVVLRGEDETGTETQPPPPTTQPQTVKPPAPPRPRALVVRIAVRDGKAPIRRVTVERGRQVVFLVTSDVEDHIHLHGYNVLRDVAPGSPARLAFRATIPGRFKVELEDRHVQIADLTVRP